MMSLPDISARGLVRRPALQDRLSATPEGGVTLVCAPPGSGKTVLLRSWLASCGERAACVPVERTEQDSQRFWLSVVDALANAAGADGSIRRTSPSPGFTGEVVVGELLSDLKTLDDPLVLLIDDLHELHSDDALRLLEWFLARLPPTLRVVLTTREEPRLGLHRIRLAGALVELRAADLRFTPEEARELLSANGIALSDEGLTLLCERTEGWVAGLRLAALSLAAHPEPERFVREFSGSERTVAGYLLAEVLERQPPEVRELLLRTSVLDRVSGPLADALTGGSGSERILQALADDNAFVTALDAGRSWFRYHHLLSDLLQLELRRTAPQSIVALHRAAAQWHEERGDVIEAIHHAEAAEDWPTAARLLALHYFDLMMEGRVATVRALLAAVPAHALDANAELPVLVAGTRVFDGLLDEAAGYLAAARGSAATIPEERRPFFDLLFATMSLWLASRRGDLGAAVEAARAFEAAFAAQPPAGIASAEEQRMLALLNLGVAELWGQRLDESRRDLEQALAVARGSRRPYLEMVCLAWLAINATLSDLPVSVARSLADDAVAMAEEHGWGADPVAAPGFIAAAATLVWVGRFEEADQRLQRALRALPAGGDPHTELIIQHSWGLLRLGQGRLEDALGAFTAAEGMQARLPWQHPFTLDLRSRILRTRVQLGETAAVRAALDDLDEQTRRRAGMRIAAATIHLAEGRPDEAVDVLGPVVERSAEALYPRWATIEALLFDAAARERMGDRRGAETSLERALEIAEPEGIVLPFAVAPVRGLLERHPGHRTAHATLLSEIRDVCAGGSPRRADLGASGHELSDAELRVIRYLPSNLKAPEIAAELFVSPNTVRTHLRHIYAKLDSHSRAESVERARELGLLAPSMRLR
jgi:LuxR family transcriptional regulator, maltose regulon positive regulatory protein